jgi:hypothetical protein
MFYTLTNVRSKPIGSSQKHFGVLGKVQRFAERNDIMISHDTLKFIRLLTVRIFWSLLTLVSIGFAISSIEFYFFLKLDIIPTYARLLEFMVSHEFAFGTGSGMQILRPYWLQMPELNKVFLAIHTTLGAICLIIGPFQFLKRLRVRFPKAHRFWGKVYVSLGLVSMVFAICYLVSTPMEKIYGGAPFAVGLWGIAILSIYSFIAAMVHAIRGEYWQHRALITLNFCALLIAPLLRIWWIVLGRIFPEYNQAQIHIAVLMFLGAQSIFAAILTVNAARPSQFVSGEKSHALTSSNSIPLRFRRLLYSICFFSGCFVFALLTLRFSVPTLTSVFNLDALAAVTRRVYANHPYAFWLCGCGSLAGVAFAPSVFIHGTNNHFGRSLFPLNATARFGFWGGTSLVAVGTLLMSFRLGNDWIRGWGGSVFFFTVGILLLLCLLMAGKSAIRGNRRGVREYALHIIAILLVPASQHLLCLGFLTFGFGFEDAYLSAAVVSVSFHLSISYYYTVYGPQADQFIRPSGYALFSHIRAELQMHWLGNASGRQRAAAHDSV